MTKVTPPVPKRLADESSYEVDPGKGWILFAGIMLAVVGVLNVVVGLAAVDNSQVFVQDVKFVFADLKTFGWLLTVFGVIQLVTSFGVFREWESARWAGIAAAAVNMILQFVFLPAHPGWTMIIFFVDVIIIFGLMTYGGRDRRSLRG